MRQLVFVAGMHVIAVLAVGANAQAQSQTFQPKTARDIASATPSASPLAVNAILVSRNDAHITFQTYGFPLLRYRYAGFSHKPYIQELSTPSGVNVLLDAPRDHAHHHGLMFALAVNGIDFWSETDQCGKQIDRSCQTAPSKTSDGVGLGRIVETLDWRDATGAQLLLCERRTIEASRWEDAVVATWESQLQPSPDKAEVTLSGSHYFGLGMRFLESMNGNGAFLNASGQPGEVVRGEERNVGADWCAYQAEADGKPVTIAMFGDPSLPRFPPTWFTMATPFAYLSATLDLHKDPMTLKRGEPLTLRYGVALWDGRQDAESIALAYRRWLDRAVTEVSPDGQTFNEPPSQENCKQAPPESAPSSPQP